MTLDEQMEKLRFGGKVQRVAEEDLAAAFFEMSQKGLTELTDRLFAEYGRDGKPRSWRQWIRQRIEPMFPYVGERPKWVGNTPRWAFLNDKPMVFIRQIDVGSGSVESTLLAPSRVLYVFGARVPVEGGWTVEYRVLEDDPRTRGLSVPVALSKA